MQKPVHKEKPATMARAHEGAPPMPAPASRSTLAWLRAQGDLIRNRNPSRPRH